MLTVSNDSDTHRCPQVAAKPCIASIFDLYCVGGRRASNEELVERSGCQKK
jgi:hypothetical protein